MNVQLRNSNGYPGPLPTHIPPRFTRCRRRGVGQSNINPTTIWTPTTGFLSTPGDVTSGTTPAVYTAPSFVPTPACSQDTRPGGAAFSAECIAQVLAAQQQNFQLQNDANRQVFVQNCLNTIPQPTDCYTRTYGQTPAGGYTSDAIVQGPQLVLDASGRVVSSSADPATGEPPVTSATPSPPTTGTKSGSASTGGTGQNGAAKPSDNNILYWTVGLGVAAIVIGILAVNK